MSNFHVLYQHFPDQELAIRRRLKSDDSVRTICNDYCEAESALRHWEAAGPEGSGRVAEYRTLLDELAEELAAHLRRPDNDTARPTTSGRAESRELQRPDDNEGSRR